MLKWMNMKCMRQKCLQTTSATKSGAGKNGGYNGRNDGQARSVNMSWTGCSQKLDRKQTGRLISNDQNFNRDSIALLAGAELMKDEECQY